MTSLMPADRWRSLVDAHFGFLRTEFGCSIAEVSDTSGWATELIYQNSTTAVSITFDLESDAVVVRLIRLVNGRRPPYPIFVSEEPVLHHHWMERLLELRRPAGEPVERRSGGLEPAEVEQQLESWATAVREYAADVLAGDFTVFVAMEEQVREWVRQHPEQIRVWMPEGTNPTTADLDRLRRGHPSIPIELRWYRRPPRR